MTNRLFTFGCSFTSYMWPTWADILSQEYDLFENWGRLGGGNHFIMYSLAECIKRNNINVDDTVMIMWTSIGREDRYLKNKWVTPGSVYNSSYSQEFVDNYTDPDGYLLTNMALIEMVKQTLDNIGCNYKMFKIVPFSMVNASHKQLTFKLSLESKIASLFSDTIDVISPSVCEIIFDNDFHSRDDVVIKMAIPDAIDQLRLTYNKCAGVDWPSFGNFYNNDCGNISQEIMDEIENDFQLVTWRDNINTKRQDVHPTPNEHLEYLQKVGVSITDKQKDYACKWDDMVLNHEGTKFKTAIPKKRF